MRNIDIESILNSLPPRIWVASWQATLLTGIILVVQWALGSQFSARWRNALWLLVFARLLLPTLPHAWFSAYNWLPRKIPAIAVPVITEPPVPVSHLHPIVSPDEEGPTQDDLQPTAPAQLPVAGRLIALPNPLSLLALLWLAGVSVTAAWSIASHARLRKRVKRSAMDAGAILKEQFAAAKALLGVRRAELMISTAVGTPFVTGFWKAKVILPEGLETKLAPGELRMVLLHELAHVKRGDLWMAWLSWLVTTLHWFNPAIRFAISRARKDREMACDEWVLRFIRDSKGYGAALIRFLEFSQNPQVRPGLGTIGIFESKVTLVQRIRRIAAYRRATLFGSAVGFGVLAIIGILTLTAATTEAPTLQLTLELSDGSRIVGTPAIDRFKVTTQYADLEIQFDQMREAEFNAENHAARLSLKNGDILNGRVAATEIAMKTLVGDVAIPLAEVRRLRVASVDGALPNGAILYDIAGYWNCNNSTEYSEVHRDGKHVVYTFTDARYTHSFEGDYVGGQTIEGIQTRRSLIDGTTTRMQMKITLQSANSGIVEWTALDSNSDLVKGQTGTATTERVTPPHTGTDESPNNRSINP